MALIVAGLYYVAVIAINASRNHDDRVVSGKPAREAKNPRDQRRR